MSQTKRATAIIPGDCIDIMGILCQVTSADTGDELTLVHTDKGISTYLPPLSLVKIDLHIPQN
jgi:hypothetical protein